MQLHCILFVQIYERRAKEVKPSELRFWQDITPDMISEEEKSGVTFVRHQPSYRSDNFNKFLRKLDMRSEKKSGNQPRIPRTMGSPIPTDPPHYMKNWMIKPDLRKSKRQTASETGGNDKEVGDNTIPHLKIIVTITLTTLIPIE